MPNHNHELPSFQGYDKAQPFVVTGKNLAFPAWLVVLGATSCFTITVYLVTTLVQVQNKLDIIWTRDEMRAYSSRMEHDNKGLSVPDADEIHRKLSY
jgi:hypothetical protein